MSVTDTSGVRYQFTAALRRPHGTLGSIAALLIGTLLITSTSQAAIVYGDFSGTTVNYINVMEDDQNLFGAPIVTGDTITFSPVSFEVTSSGVMPPRLVDGTVGMIIDAKPGQSITGFSISEAGAFTLLGTGTAATRVMVALTAVVNVLEVDGVAVPGGLPLADSMLFADFNLLDDGTSFSTPWTNGGTIDIAALALNAGITGEVTKLSLVIGNSLVAMSESGSTSFIDKKAINGLSVTVPEPASLALVALGGLLMLRRPAA